jgi:hypothetical protein
MGFRGRVLFRYLMPRGGAMMGMGIWIDGLLMARRSVSRYCIKSFAYPTGFNVTGW